MLRIAICDDLPEQLAKIEAGTKKYFSAYINEPVEIHTYNGPFVLLESFENEPYDILLLDICMPNIDGTQVAAGIRRRGAKTEIIFITTSDEFAVDAFALKAAHYLLKPFTQAQLDDALDRAMSRFSEHQTLSVSLRIVGKGVITLEINDILWIESNGHKQFVFLNSGKKHEIHESFSQLLSIFDKLSEGQFVSPYKGYLVNQKAIRTIAPKYITMRSGDNIPLPRGSFRKFSDNYFTYMFPKEL